MTAETMKSDASFESDGITVEDLCLLANTFTENGYLDKAIHIYESACRLFPENLALKINLGRVRSMQKESMDSPKQILVSHGENESESNSWFERFQGLGELLHQNGKRDAAEQVFSLSISNQPGFYLPYLQLGKLYLEAGKIVEALKELEKALHLNPFNEEVVDLLSVAHLQNRDFEQALKYSIDALILSGEISRKSTTGKYRSKIKSVLEKIPNMTPSARNELIHERQRRINRLFEEKETEMHRVAEDEGIRIKASTEPSPKGPDAKPSAAEDKKVPEDPQKTYDMALRLKKHLIFRNMDDEAVLKVGRFTSQVELKQGEYVYHESDPVYGFYLLNQGKVEIQKNTPYGPLIYASLGPGSFFGDDNLLSGRERFSNAVSIQESSCLFIDKAGLATIFAREREIAIHFLWYFWKSLSFQIRESNDRMTSFFAASQKVPSEEPTEEKTLPPLDRKRTHIEIDRKLEVLASKGLNTKELSVLAKFSNEEIYNAGETIFNEGDVGDRLYIVLQGSVLISKDIPGTGREALSILQKGDFFGEMALIGNNHRRSADARAQEQGTTVLVINSQALREILSIDTDSAYQFLTILCRILTQRLLEMNEKIYQWQMMAGGFGENSPSDSNSSR